jgi:hypothetical protein
VALEADRHPADSESEILYVTRGEVVEVFRIRLIEGEAAALERYENGEFLPARVFSIASPVTSVGAQTRSSRRPERLERAIRRALTYLDGSVSVGERDLLSPTSAMTRNLRWFPGDIQMLGTSFHYVRELFPSAQFHVTQLFRRVFGDVAFLGLILFSSACWLRTSGHAGLATLALVLQLASIMAIIGFDRFWEPIRYRWKEVRQVRAPNDGLRGALELVVIVLSQVAQGIAAVTINTLVGLTNLLIHPLKVVESFQKVRRGKSLEWKASSVSTGQDMRGWPVSDFLAAYGGAARVGLSVLLFLGWLVLLGAPLDLFGLNSVGLFLASFLSAWFYAWHAALPHSAESGAPQYELSRGEFWGLTLVGVAGLVLSLTLFGAGLYPMPAFESSTGVVALFLTVTCAFAAVFPSYYELKRRHAKRTARAGSGFRPAPAWLALGGGLALGLTLLGSPALRDRAKHFFVPDKARFRMPDVERRVYLAVGSALKRTRVVDPEPLLSATGTQLTLGATTRGPVLDTRELRGLPAPRPRRLARRDVTPSPALYPLPLAQRIPSNIPRRDFVLRSADAPARTQPAQAERLNAILEARRRARAMVARVLSPAELLEQGRFLAQAEYPWIGREELEKLGAADAQGARLPLVEMARVHRFDEVKSLWDQVPAARDGAPSPSARFARLLDGIDGAVSLGLEPNAGHVQDFVSLEREVAERWPREFPNVPLGAVRERVTGTTSNPFLVARYAQLHGLGFDDLARSLRLDYVDLAWNKPAVAPGVRQLFRDRIEVEQRDRLELDWGDSIEAAARFEDLQVEQLIGTKILRSALGSELASPVQLEHVLGLVESSLGSSKGGSPNGLAAGLAQNFEMRSVQPIGTRADSGTNQLRARLWTQTMSGRVGQIAARAGSDSPLPGSEAEHALLAEVAKLRFPDDSGDPLQTRALEWLVLVDASETYRELVDGYQRFQTELLGRGYASGMLQRAPTLSAEQQWRDLFLIWRDLPPRFSNIPARADMVAEFICQTAYFSSSDGKHGRTPEAFLRDFQSVFADVDRMMPEAPPPVIQELSDSALLKTRGRLSRSPEARRFFAWWSVVVQARTVNYNLERHHLQRAAEPRELAGRWAEIVTTGLARWPHLPFRVPGFAEYFLNVEQVDALSLPALWRRYERQLDHANRLSMQHVLPSGGFEALVERRIAEKTGAPNFDPQTRRANAILALSELSDAAAANSLHFEDGRAPRLSALLARLYESVTRDYPNLYWDGEGTLESYTLLALVNGWQPQRMLREFAPEWSLANALAAGGLLERLAEIAEREPSKLNPRERAIRTFIDTQALRLQKKTGLRVPSARSSGMNALIALSNIALGSGEEGLLPAQTGSAWSKQRVRQWASQLGSTRLDRTMTTWASELAADFGELIGNMRAEGPHFPWEDGAFVETELLVARSSGINMGALRAARRETWHVASELAERRVTPPSAFVRLIEQDSESELAQKLAAARGTTPDRISEAELRALADPENVVQSSVLALADVLAQIRVAYAAEPDPVSIARAIAGVRAEGPRRYPNVPWAAKGFASSLLVAAQRPSFDGDVWRYAEFIDLPAVDQLLGQADRSAESSSASSGAPAANGDGPILNARLPADVLEDMSAIMTEQTGRTPSSERVVAFQALRDGLFLTKEFVPEVEPSLSAATALVQIRARVRALAQRFPALHIVTGGDQTPRVGFADRLAAIAARQTLRSGLHVDDPSFADRAVELLESQYLRDLSRIYALVRQSFPAQELDYYKQAILRDARIDNAQKAQQSGLSADVLSVPQVNDDDIVADFALYELLYAKEIGQSPAYVVDLFEIYDKLQSRSDVRADFQRGLAELDRRAPALPQAGSSDPSLRDSAEFAAWWEQRGDFVKRTRGNLLALARTFALLKEHAFSEQASPDARAAFSRFGNFDRYLTRFFDDLASVRRTPGLERALSDLAKQDPFLADGVTFAIAQFKLHVLDRAYPAHAESERVLHRVAEFVPKVNADYRAALGFSPGLESGVPFYDALSSFVRADVQATPGTDLLRRLNVVQRGLQSWTQTYFLKRAYKVLFDRDLDEEDPTPVPAHSPVTRMRTTVGNQVHEFLESKLPQRLERETGGNDAVVWLKWLMDNGELDLQAQSLGKNPYAEAMASYERRLSDYRTRVRLGEASGKNVRAERQRILDIEREYGSLQRQVDSLKANAVQQAGFGLRASRDYHEAIWQSALWLLGILASGALVRLAAKRLAPSRVATRRWVFNVTVACALSLGALPFWVAANPEAAERWAGAPLSALRLLEISEDGAPRARGAAAQLERTQPLSVLLGTMSRQASAL